jgi:glycosyltransferase involved in cell wall biosynthesis
MAKAAKKLKILTIAPGLNLGGGIESYIMNYYSRIHNDVEMDFLTHDIFEDTYKKIIEKNGDKIYLLPRIGLNFLKIDKLSKEFFEKHHDYDIVHCHMANAAFIHLKYAKKYGIKVRIIHSHQNKAADTLSHAIRNIPLLRIGLKYANTYFACSKFAGDYLFKKRKYHLINNAIDAKRFKYDPKKRKEMRKQLGIKDDCFLIGNVGRLCPQKNQRFLIDVFTLVSEKTDAKLLIIGDGELKKDLETHIKELKLEDKVIILDPVSNVEDYYQAMDMFVLPSLYEGLGIVNIEAQACGLKTIVSDKVPDIAKISDLLTFVNLKATEQEWADVILENKDYTRKEQKDILKKSGYDLDYESEKLVDLYKKLI